MIKWLKKIFTVDENAKFSSGLTVKDYVEMKAYHERDHHQEMEDVIAAEMPDKIDVEIVKKLFKETK